MIDFAAQLPIHWQEPDRGIDRGDRREEGELRSQNMKVKVVAQTISSIKLRKYNVKNAKKN